MTILSSVKADSPRPPRGRGFAKQANFGLVFVGFLSLVFGTSSAHAQVGTVLLEAGTWVAGQLISYATGKAIDKVVGIDYENELRQVEASLSAQIKKERADKEKLRVELAATRSTLDILNKLIRSRPQSGEIDEFRQQLAKNLDSVLAVQIRDSERITQLERQVTELSTRLRQLEAAPPVNSFSGRAFPAPVEFRRPQRPRKSEIQVQANKRWNRSGITLAPGDEVTFNANGKVSTLPGGNLSGPSGQRYACDAKCTVPNGFYGQLIGKVGEGGKVFVVDDGGRVAIEESGELFLGVNDCCNWNDNSGSFSVLVMIGAE